MSREDGGTTVKAELLHSFRQGREALLWKLDGVSEYDGRRPSTLTGTTLLRPRTVSRTTS
ncbi:hypothetical protein [Pseudonocardia terrae]|uniref:hypothetical protein n=1 Tax=Pseudonocardia terrae TaxID=2905831 RepID=UPI00272E6298|nr:hypothetical protein [Pseudonocardia terrae]